MFNRLKKPTGTALMAIDDVVGNPPFIVRRDHRIVAAFAKRNAAIDWAQMRSFNDESHFVVHTSQEIVGAFQDGEEQT
jgi:hypothetical protein